MENTPIYDNLVLGYFGEHDDKESDFGYLVTNLSKERPILIAGCAGCILHSSNTVVTAALPFGFEA